MFSTGRPLLQITGTLLRDAEVRMKAIGPDDTPMPVLCLAIRVDGPGQRTVQAEQAYPSTSRFAADAQALRLRAGATVSIKADPQAMCLSLTKAHNLRVEDSTALCELLGLGKVSPRSALADHIKETSQPDVVHLLITAQADSDPTDRDSPYTGRKANQGMHLVLESVFGPSSPAVLKEIQAEAAEAFLKKPAPLQPAAPEAASTPTPAAHADDSARKGKKRKTPAAPAGDHAGRVSAAEAQANIAAALQAAEESNPGAAQAAQGDEPGPVADALGQAGGSNEAAADVGTGATGEVGPGATVRINDSVPKHQVKFIGKTGTVERVVGDGSCWWVVFTGKFKAQGSFHITELDLVAAAPAQDAPGIDQAAGPEHVEEVAAPAGDAAPGADEPVANIEPAAAEQTSAATALEPGQVVRVKATTINKKWRGREVTVMSRKTKDLADTDPIWAVRFGTPPKHVDGQFFASDLEPVDHPIDQGAA